MTEMIDIIAAIPDLTTRVKSSAPGLLTLVDTKIKNKFPKGLSIQEFASKLQLAPDRLRALFAKKGEKLFDADKSDAGFTQLSEGTQAGLLNSLNSVGDYVDALLG